MGEGQEKVARDKNNAAFITGGWLILQNCHLGIDYMNEVEDELRSCEAKLLVNPGVHTPRGAREVAVTMVKLTMELIDIPGSTRRTRGIDAI